MKRDITIKQNTENKIVIGLDDCGIDAVITFDSKFNYKTSFAVQNGPLTDTYADTYAENITDVKCYLEPTNNDKGVECMAEYMEQKQ